MLDDVEPSGETPMTAYARSLPLLYRRVFQPFEISPLRRSHGLVPTSSLSSSFPSRFLFTLRSSPAKPAGSDFQSHRPPALPFYLLLVAFVSFSICLYTPANRRAGAEGTPAELYPSYLSALYCRYYCRLARTRFVRHSSLAGPTPLRIPN